MALPSGSAFRKARFPNLSLNFCQLDPEQSAKKRGKQDRGSSRLDKVLKYLELFPFISLCN